jgi:hypothetical protein
MHQQGTQQRGRITINAPRSCPLARKNLPRLSAANITPSLKTSPKTEVPVTSGCLVICHKVTKEKIGGAMHLHGEPAVQLGGSGKTYCVCEFVPSPACPTPYIPPS